MWQTYYTPTSVDEALRLLASTQLEAKEIAARVGFESYHSFARAVRRETGVSPAQYRRQMTSNAKSAP